MFAWRIQGIEHRDTQYTASPQVLRSVYCLHTSFTYVPKTSFMSYLSSTVGVRCTLASSLGFSLVLALPNCIPSGMVARVAGLAGCVTVAGLTAHCCLPCPSVTTCSCARERAGAHGSAPRSGRAWRCSALRENSAVAAVRGGDWRSTLSFNLSLKLILGTNDREDNNSWARHDPTAGWRRGVGTSWISPSRL